MFEKKKLRVYSKYSISDNAFFPLPFGRTNVLSQDVFDFCSLVGRHLPKYVRADEKLRASFIRSIYVGVSQTFNLALRRLQLSVTQNRSLTSIPLALLSAPYAVVPRPRPVHPSSRPVLTKAALIDRLAAALADPFQSDDARGLRSPVGAAAAAVFRVCGEAGAVSPSFVEGGGG